MAGGKRRAERQDHARPRLGPLSRLGGTVLGIVLGCAAWWFLVRAAIDFARLGVAGESRAWVFATASSVGAVLCLLLVLVLASRLLVTLGVVSEYQPRRAAPRRRAEPASKPTSETASEPAGKRASEPAAKPTSRRAERADAPPAAERDHAGRREGSRRAERDHTSRRRAARHSDAPAPDRTVG